MWEFQLQAVSFITGNATNTYCCQKQDPKNATYYNKQNAIRQGLTQEILT